MSVNYGLLPIQMPSFSSELGKTLRSLFLQRKTFIFEYGGNY